MEMGSGGGGGGRAVGGSTSSVLDVRGGDGEDMGCAGQKGDEEVLELHVESLEK